MPPFRDVGFVVLAFDGIVFDSTVFCAAAAAAAAAAIEIESTFDV